MTTKTAANSQKIVITTVLDLKVITSHLSTLPIVHKKTFISIMAINDKAESSDQVHSLAEAGNSQEQPLDASRSSVVSKKDLSKEVDDTQRSNTEAYDPENPMPYFLAKEAKYMDADSAKTPEEFRMADVKHTLSYQSIFCWTLVTILLVGGSFSAMVLTVDWNATADDNADLADSTFAESP